MIINTAGIIFYRGFYLFGEAGHIHNELFQCPVLELRVFFQCAVQIVDIGLQMSVVVQPHGFFIDIGFHGIIRIRQGRVDKFIVVIHLKIPFFIMICQKDM